MFYILSRPQWVNISHRTRLSQKAKIITLCSCKFYHITRQILYRIWSTLCDWIQIRMNLHIWLVQFYLKLTSPQKVSLNYVLICHRQRTWVINDENSYIITERLGLWVCMAWNYYLAVLLRQNYCDISLFYLFNKILHNGSRFKHANYYQLQVFQTMCTYKPCVCCAVLRKHENIFEIFFDIKIPWGV